jgi:hypothetical protein
MGWNIEKRKPLQLNNNTIPIISQSIPPFFPHREHLKRNHHVSKPIVPLLSQILASFAPNLLEQKLTELSDNTIFLSSN